MRIITPSLALGAVLLTGFSGSLLLAQDQTPASGAPVATSPSASQGTHQANPQRQAKKMAKKLGLTADQQAKLEPILADRAQQIQAVHADSTLAPQDMRAKIKAIHQSSNANIEALLTDAQKQQFEQMQANHRNKKQQQQTAPANS